MLSTIAHQRNTQNTSFKNYSAQVPRGYSLQVFKQPTLSSFPYTTATTKFDVGYHNNVSRADPNWHYVQQPLLVATKTSRRPSEERELQRGLHKTSGTISAYPNEYYSAPSNIDTASTSTLISSTVLSSTTESTSSSVTMVEESPPLPPPRNRSSTPMPSSLALTTRTTSTSRPSAQAILRNTSYTSYDDYISTAPAAISTEREYLEDELDLIARRNAELNATASRRDSLILTSLDLGMPAQIFPSVPRSTSPEPINSLQAAINTSQANNTQIIPFSSTNMINPDDQFIPPLGKWDMVGGDGRPFPDERPPSRSDKRRSYVSVQKNLPSIQDRPLPLPPTMTRESNLSITGSEKSSHLKTSYPASQELNALLSYTFPPPSNDQQRTGGTRSRSNSISRKSSSSQAVSLSRRNSVTPTDNASAPPIINNATTTKKDHRAPDPVSAPPLRTRKPSFADSIVRMPSQGPEGRIAIPSRPPSRSGREGEIVSSRSRAPFVERRHHSDDHITTLVDQPLTGQEPQRRHSDGDQYRGHGHSRGAAARNVRWNENLICPSPIFTEKRKGWYNRRGIFFSSLAINSGQMKGVTSHHFQDKNILSISTVIPNMGKVG